MFTVILLHPAAAAVLRWVGFCGAAVLVGAASLQRLDRGGLLSERARASLLRLVHVAAVLVFTVGVVRMVQQALAFAPEPAQMVPMMLTLGTTTWGVAWAVQMVVCAIVAIAPWRVVVTSGATWPGACFAMIVAATPAFQGHAVGSPRLTWLAVAADVAHLVAGGVWVGTLFLLVALVLRSTAAGAAIVLVRRFTPWALGGAATLGATGLFSSWLHVQKLPLLWGSLYGRLILLKVVLVAVVALIGAINWKRMAPKLAGPGGVEQLAKSARAEVIVAVLVLAVTAVLVATPLPNE